MSANTSQIKSCFDDIISVRDVCPQVVATSGLYIDDAGITLNELNEYATESFKDGMDLFRKKLNFSIAEVASKVHTFLQPKYVSKSVIENMRVGFYQDNLNMIDAMPGNLRLMQFELINSDSYIDLFVSEISLQLDYDGDVDITVFDLITGKNIDTIKIPCKKNERSTVFPMKTYKSNRHKLNLVFAYESAGKKANTTWLLRDGSCAGCGGKKSYNNQYVRITPGKMESTIDKIDKNIVETADTGGISIVYSLSCNHTDWLCARQNIVALPILWKTAAAIMEHAALIAPGELMTPRIQSSHLLYARMQAYEKRFSDSFDEAMKNISIPSDSKCFVCNNRISHRIMIPG